jgi:hypothetical protein
MYASALSGIDANRKIITGKGWKPVGRTLIGETYHALSCFSLHAQANLSANHPNDVSIPSCWHCLAAFATISATLPEMWWLCRCNIESLTGTPTQCTYADTPSRLWRMSSASVSSWEENCLSKRKTTWVPRSGGG